jgi:tRNA threonylcarbamoyladenosine biosynthesis protein TsaB
MSPRLLAIDTSTLTAGVAAFADGRTVAERRRVVTVHSESLLTLVDEALAEAGLLPKDLDAVVCGAGPGSFTGLRIGLATAKGLCFALGRPLVLVSSLATLAARAPVGSDVCAVLDAYRGEVYAGRYRITAGGPQPLAAESVSPPDRLAAELRLAGPVLLVGAGALKYPELVADGRTLLDDDGAPRPSDLARLGAARLAAGESDPLGPSGPRYIRASEAEIMKNKLRNQ